MISMFFAEVKAQDVHFTSYDFSPLTLNPALAGSFSGTYRVGGIYRDQWRSVAGSGGFKTPTIHIDAPVIRGIRRQDWIGIGVGLYRDESSNTSQNGTRYSLIHTKSFQGISYHLSLDKKQTKILSFGVQNGTASRSAKLQGDLRTETFILGQNSGGGGTTDNALLANSDGNTIVDWAGGVTYSQQMRSGAFVRAGLSVGHINRANQSFINATDQQKLKYTVFGMYDVPISGNLFLTPSVMYARTNNNQELLAQAKASYLMDAEKGIFVNAGLGTRIGDAIMLLGGMDYKSLKVQLAYDMNVSGLRRGSNTLGAFEIAVSYIGKVFTKPKVDRTKVCPRL